MAPRTSGSLAPANLSKSLLCSAPAPPPEAATITECQSLEHAFAATTTEEKMQPQQPSAFYSAEHLPLGEDGKDCFRWRARFWHPTYCGLVPAELLLSKLARLTSIRTLGHSVVHERSDAQVPYDHTHLAWMWERAPNLHGSRLLDIELDGVQLHPHMVHKKSLKWLQHIFQRYHHGHKTTLTGKPTFVAPVGGPWQVLWRCGCHLPACFRCSHSVLSGTTLS